MKNIECFNSMIVRLKEGAAFFVKVAAWLFQFYDSPIKRSVTGCCSPIPIRFNSMIVRLKVQSLRFRA